MAEKKAGEYWICQECGTPMNSYRDGKTEVTECPNWASPSSGWPTSSYFGL